MARPINHSIKGARALELYIVKVNRAKRNYDKHIQKAEDELNSTLKQLRDDKKT